MADTSIQPNTGQLVLARGHAIPTPLRASLEITGAAPSLIQGTVIIPGTGSLEFGELGGPTPGTGALALIGQTPTVGVAPILEVDTRLMVASGSLLLTGEAPTIGGAVQITPGAGALVLAGQTAILGGAVQIVPGTGLLTLAGLEPRQDRGLFPGTGALALDGL